MRKHVALLLILCSSYVFSLGRVISNPPFSENPSCDLNAGMADSYVLALSSQPGFCQTYGYEAGKPECKHITADSHEANNLSLHGLWPNENACGIHYGYCNATQLTNHCDYAPLQFSSTTGDALKEVMPSYRHGSCLERHEWNKHGTCQILSNDEYFSLAIRLLHEANQTTLSQYISAHKGQKVKLSALHQQAKDAFGSDNVHKVYFGCNKGILVDVYISLPALIPYNEPLLNLINNAPNYPMDDNCPSTLTISNFTGPSKGIWF